MDVRHAASCVLFLAQYVVKVCRVFVFLVFFFFFQAEDGIRDDLVTGVQTCALPICIQREIASDLVLDVAYVGSRNLDLINSLNMNQASAGPGPLQPRRRLYAIDPALQDVDYRTNWGASKYHSLQVNVRKRYSKGLTLGVAYTWSHNLTNTRQPNASPRPQDPNCSACEWGNAPEDRRHTLVVNHLYELPFGKGRSFLNHGILAHLVGSWDLSGVWTMYSG